MEPNQLPITLANMIKQVTDKPQTQRLPLTTARKEVERINDRLAIYGFTNFSRTTFKGETRADPRRLHFAKPKTGKFPYIPVISKDGITEVVVGANGVTPADAEKENNDALNSLFDLLTRRSSLLAGIVRAQALPGTVTIGNDVFSIAEALAIREDYSITTNAKIKLLAELVQTLDLHTATADTAHKRAIAEKRSVLNAQPREMKKLQLAERKLPVSSDSEIDTAYMSVLDAMMKEEAVKYTIVTKDKFKVRDRMNALVVERDAFLNAIDTALDVANVNTIVVV